MNRIEEKLAVLKDKNEKAFITYMTAGLPDMEGCKELMKVQEEAGVDILELGIPFSDPVADGPVIQAASYKSIRQGTNVTKVFEMVGKARKESCHIPIIFMMYFNTLLYYGLEKFVDSCITAGVDGLIIPDLPYEEQAQLTDILKVRKEAPLLIQLVTPVSKQRIPMLLKEARGFVYCVSSMGVTGQNAAFHEGVIDYLKEVKEISKIPVMMGFGIRQAADVKPMKDVIDGCIVGSHFITTMEESNYSQQTVREYCGKFKSELNHIAQ